MPKTTRRQFTDAFKSEAVRLTRESGRPVAQVARELGISDNGLYRWRTEQQQVESQGRTRQAVRAEQDELTRVGGELLNYVASTVLRETTSVVPSNACGKYFSSSFTC